MNQNTSFPNVIKIRQFKLFTGNLLTYNIALVYLIRSKRIIYIKISD